MTIRQLKEPCWAIRPPLPREDGDPCYDSRAEALAAIREAWDEDRDWAFDDQLRVRWREFLYRLSRLRPGAPRPRRLAGRCWVVQCDGECETILDTEDEGCVYHHHSRAAAMDTVKAYDWRYAGDRVFCEEDAPADGQVPPPTPAELEAAGQMRLPGVA